MITIVFSSLAVIISTIVMTCGETQKPLEETFVPEEKTMLQFCSEMKNYMENFSIEDFVKNINNQWELLYPREADKNGTNQCRTDWERNMNKFFEDCGIQTEIRTKVTRQKSEDKVVEAGVIDIRTLGQSNADFVIKLKQKNPSCTTMRLLLRCIEADSFQPMYPNFKITVLALSFSSVHSVVIHDWIALLYEKGEIIDAKHSNAKCLQSKQFEDLNYKGTRLLNYFEQ